MLPRGVRDRTSILWGFRTIIALISFNLHHLTDGFRGIVVGQLHADRGEGRISILSVLSHDIMSTPSPQDVLAGRWLNAVIFIAVA